MPVWGPLAGIRWTASASCRPAGSERLSGTGSVAHCRPGARTDSWAGRQPRKPSVEALRATTALAERGRRLPSRDDCDAAAAP